ncbi:hypothetical protein [Marinomonas algicola]|uniref:hypothetical protein n=1 Tax=Marinomonas algicola TaxID=2773454 RepID=UPI00174DAA27|nr:hypothetical protein [Marinomonas algicola]
MNTSNQNSVFELVDDTTPKILLVGIGGCGCSAVEVMGQTAIASKVTLAAVNTDQRELKLTQVSLQVPIGDVITKGLGAGSMPHVGEQSARESLNALQDMIHGYDLVITISGGGGGTGTGATPVVLELCEQLNVPTIAFVVRPFAFEGKRRLLLADTLIERCRQSAGTTFVLENAKLQQALGQNAKLDDALDAANQYINELISGLLAMVDSDAVARIDFAHFIMVLSGRGVGYGAVIEAGNYGDIVDKLTDFPLLQGMQDAHTEAHVIMHIWAPESFTLSEYSNLSEALHGQLSGNLDVSSGFSVWEKTSFKVVLFVNHTV